MAALLPTAGALSGIDDVCVRGFGIADTASSSLWEGRMRPGQASQTLLITSIMRARHQLFDSPLILDDPVVLRLVPEARDPSVLSDFGDSREPKATLARTLLAVRSRFTEDRLAQAATCGVRQYVMFGAGLDTFRWRQPDFAKHMQIFAVDHPASLAISGLGLASRKYGMPSEERRKSMRAYPSSSSIR